MNIHKHDSANDHIYNGGTQEMVHYPASFMSLLGYKGVQNVALVLLKLVFLSVHSVSPSNICE